MFLFAILFVLNVLWLSLNWKWSLTWSSTYCIICKIWDWTMTEICCNTKESLNLTNGSRFIFHYCTKKRKHSLAYQQHFFRPKLIRIWNGGYRAKGEPKYIPDAGRFTWHEEYCVRLATRFDQWALFIHCSVEESNVENDSSTEQLECSLIISPICGNSGGSIF